MDWRHLFLSVDGRISRKPYWLGVAGVLLASLALQAGAVELGLYAFRYGAAERLQVQSVNLVIALLLVYPSAAIIVKRLHDRGRTGWWGALIYGPALAAPLLDLAGIVGTFDNPSAISIALSLVTFVFGVWFFIELGFLKGTQGPNLYGPDPLAAVMADAAM